MYPVDRRGDTLPHADRLDRIKRWMSFIATPCIYLFRDGRDIMIRDVGSVRDNITDVLQSRIDGVEFRDNMCLFCRKFDKCQTWLLSNNGSMFHLQMMSCKDRETMSEDEVDKIDLPGITFRVHRVEVAGIPAVSFQTEKEEKTAVSQEHAPAVLETVRSAETSADTAENENTGRVTDTGTDTGVKAGVQTEKETSTEERLQRVLRTFRSKNKTRS